MRYLQTYVARNMRSNIRIFGLLSLMISYGCQNDISVSDTASLDNFASDSGTEIQRNNCSGTFSEFDLSPTILIDKKIPSSEHAALKDRVVRTLTAVPNGLKRPFASHGNIMLTPDVESKCDLTAAEKDFASEGGKLEACWTISEGITFLVLDPRNDAIEHHTVRLFAYLSGKVYPMLASATESELSESGESDTRKLNNLKEALVGSFQADLANSGRNPERISRMRAAGAAAFRNFLYAEAFDSYYCSTKSRSRMDSLYPLTAKLWLSAIVRGEPVETNARGNQSTESLDQGEAQKTLALMETNSEIFALGSQSVSTGFALQEPKAGVGNMVANGAAAGLSWWQQRSNRQQGSSGSGSGSGSYGSYGNSGSQGSSQSPPSSLSTGEKWAQSIAGGVAANGPYIASEMAGAIQPAAGAAIIVGANNNRNALIEEMARGGNENGNWNTGAQGYGNGQSETSQRALGIISEW